MGRSWLLIVGSAIVACTTGDARTSSTKAPADLASCPLPQVIGEGFVPKALSRHGVVVGTRNVAKGVTSAFAWVDGAKSAAIELASLDGGNSEANAVNESAVIVGTSSAHAVRWKDGVVDDLGTLGGPSSSALDVNDRGEIVGYATTEQGNTHAFVWRDGAMVDLGTLGGKRSGATRINGRGQIIGWSLTSPPTEMHAFLWDDGAMTDLGEATGAIDVNDNGEVIVQADLDAGFWRSGVLTEVAPFDDTTTTFIHALDPHGRVVGSTVAGGREVGFLWDEGVVTPIDIEGSNGWVTPIALNGGGQVVGFAKGPAGGRAFVWQDGEMRFLAEEGANSIATAVNDAGTVIGTSDGYGMVWRASPCHGK